MGNWRASGWGRHLGTVDGEPLAGAAVVGVRSCRVPILGRPVSTTRIQIATALIVLNVCDVVLTKLVLANGGMEGNPLMRGLMEGTATPIGVKALFASVAGLFLFLCPAESKLADRAAVTVAGLYLAVVMWNASLLAYLWIFR